jgi:magnesium transporter
MVDFITTKSEKTLLNLSGLLVREDLFASIWKSAKNRWIWLSFNLCTAFIASRVIGNFEETIGEFVALATLIPIVAIISNSAGSQTRTSIIQSLESGFDNQESTSRSLKKELAISLVNGAVWGSLASFFVYLVYKNLLLCGVLFGTLLVSQLFGALLAALIPVAMHKIDRDSSAFSSSILIATITTCGSLFIFFELAGIFLIK